MEKYITKEYLTAQYNLYTESLKDRLTGALVDLHTRYTLNADGKPVDEDGNLVTLVSAINEVIKYIINSLVINDTTYANWVATKKDEVVDPDDKLITRIYRITDAWDEADAVDPTITHHHQAGGWIYSSKYEEVAGVNHYVWSVLDNEATTVGNIANLKTTDKTDAVRAINELFDVKSSTYVVDALPDLTDPTVVVSAKDLYILHEVIDAATGDEYYTPYILKDGAFVCIYHQHLLEDEDIDFTTELTWITPDAPVVP